jgi:3-oxoacyl-[acyl-carrier protein] reductase
MNVIVTGVSKGLGLKICEDLLKKGHTVYGFSRTKTELLNTLISEYTNYFFHFSFDLSNSDLIYDFLKKEIGYDVKIDAFVNNAAIAYDDLSTNLNISKLQKMYNVNVFTPMVITKFVIKNMLYNKLEGSIVHISSISTQTGYKGLSMYASTKGSIESYSKNISREWGEKKIRSNCVVVGFMSTDMSSTLSDFQKSKIINRNSLKELTDLSTVSNTVEFLISKSSKSITGQLINVDSGTI